MSSTPQGSPTARIVSVGELLLRLRAPGAERLMQTPGFEASFGGAEFNVLASLARFGLQTEFVTALPSDALGTAALGAIRQQSVGHAHVLCAPGRLGLYFLEAGNSVRPARIIYDRAASVFAQVSPSVFDWGKIIEPSDWLHLTGITPAVSESAAQIARSAASAAVAVGARLSIDINHRPQLWQATRRTPLETLQPLLQKARIVFATPIDWGACLPVPGPPPMQDSDGFPGFAAEMFRTYPALELLITGHRAADDSSNFELGGVAQRRGSPPVVGKRIRVRAAAERIGSGDAFVAGCLFGFLGGWPDAKWLDFGVAARALKHTIPGDINLTSVSDVESLLGGERQGSVFR